MTTATKLASDTKKADEKAAKEATERTAAIAKIDADFREEVKAASDKRTKALLKYPDLNNYAERAWNDTKSEEDATYAEVSLPYRQKLDAVVEAVKTTGNADVVGLEAFEERVRELIAAEKPVALQPSLAGGRPAVPPAGPQPIRKPAAAVKKPGK